MALGLKPLLHIKVATIREIELFRLRTIEESIIYLSSVQKYALYHMLEIGKVSDIASAPSVFCCTNH